MEFWHWCRRHARPPRCRASRADQALPKLGGKGEVMEEATIKDEHLNALQRVTLDYYIHEVNHSNGLIGDRTENDSPASIAAVGMALASTPVIVGRGIVQRDVIAKYVLTTLRFFWTSPQGAEPDSTGFKGFYYHFLDMKTGRRAGNCDCPPSIRRSSSPGFSRREPIFIMTMKRKTKFGYWPTNFIEGWTGRGR